MSIAAPAAPPSPALEHIIDVCADLQIDVRAIGFEDGRKRIVLKGPGGETIRVSLCSGDLPMLEQVLRGMKFAFSSLPLLVRGDSKEIRLLTPRVAVARLLPTVYSYTTNRYGVVPGTAELRARFSATIFRAMASEPGPAQLQTAFLGLVEAPDGPLLIEEVVDTCNLEVRVKRFHIGSPVHRYRNVERHGTARAGPPLQRWSRFDVPVVCFDWRHPLQDEQGFRLADEPLPDDYAALWMDSIPRAKRLAHDTFIWIEHRFARASLQLVDLCLFIDRTGSVVYGEISPDCMRVRSRGAADADALDKDHWRSGGTADELLERYQRLHESVFGAP